MENLGDYAKDLVKLFNESDTSIAICSKTLPADIYQRPEVVNAMSEALEKGLWIRIFTGPEPKTTPQYPGRLEVYSLSREPTVNFVVGIRKSPDSLQHRLGLLPSHQEKLLFSPGEEGVQYKERHWNYVSGKYLLGRFNRVYRELRPVHAQLSSV